MKQNIIKIVLLFVFVASVGPYPISDEIGRLLPMKNDSFSSSVSLVNRDLSLRGRDEGFINGSYEDIKYVIGVYESLEDLLTSVVPNEALQSVSEFVEFWKDVFSSDVWNLTYSKIKQLIKQGLLIQSTANNFAKKINSVNNTNVKEPKVKIYPSSDKKDAPCSIFIQREGT